MEATAIAQLQSIAQSIRKVAERIRCPALLVEADELICQAAKIENAIHKAAKNG